MGQYDNQALRILVGGRNRDMLLGDELGKLRGRKGLGSCHFNCERTTLRRMMQMCKRNRRRGRRVGIEVTTAKKRMKGLISIPPSGSDIIFWAGCEAKLANRNHPPPEEQKRKKKKTPIFVFFTISQRSRPLRKMATKELIGHVPAPFLRGRRPGQAGLHGPLWNATHPSAPKRKGKVCVCKALCGTQGIE